MKIYKVTPDLSNVKGFNFDKHNDTSLTITFEGKSCLEEWKKLPTSMHDTNPKLPWTDFLRFLTNNLVMTSEVKSMLEHLDADYEWLKLPFNEKDIFVLNILYPIDCFDEENADCTYFEFNGVKEVDRVKKWSFHKARLDENKSLFKIPEMLSQDIFCTEGFLPPEKEFKHIVESNGFTGLKFIEVWSDDEE